MRFGTLGPPHQGTEPYRDLIRTRQLEQARSAGWPELDRDDLIFGRYVVEHRPSGDFFGLYRGALTEAVYSGAVAFFVDASGGIQFLEPPSGFPSNRADLEQRQAERERRRNAPKPRRRQATRRREQR